MDLEAPGGGRAAVVPRFNTLVAFRVPRWHAVTPLAPGAPRRLSLFGWFLRPGEAYEVQQVSGGDSDGGGGSDDEEEEEEEEDER